MQMLQHLHGVPVAVMVGGGSSLSWCQQRRLKGRLCHYETQRSNGE